MKRIGFAAFALALLCAGPGKADFINPSFETGDFTGWVTHDLAFAVFPLSVQPAGQNAPGGWSWSSTPTDGNFVAFSGFDGTAGTISGAQDVAIPAGRSKVMFDWRAAWNLTQFGATKDKTFDVDIQPAGGGANLLTQNILTAMAGTANADTGPQTSSVDVSAFAGQTVRVSFDLFVPENFKGAAQFQLDNVHLLQASAIPEPSSLLLAGIAGIGLAARGWSRKRQEVVA